MVTGPSLANTSVSRTVDPLRTGRTRPRKTTRGSGPEKYTGWPTATGIPPAGSVTDVAVPAAVIFSRVSVALSGEVLIRARKTLAELPARRVRPSGAPRMNTFLMAMLPAVSVAESVGG